MHAIKTFHENGFLRNQPIFTVIRVFIFNTDIFLRTLLLFLQSSFERLQKLEQAQDLAEEVFDAEVSLERLIASVYEAQGTGTNLELAENVVYKFKEKFANSIFLCMYSYM